ncbi:MAG: 16S rRNA (adenine(1518)-N(6)/adenine(1519)-N(6))-dimethyltransferase RsmA [Candidatus Paceibacterota bacterium]|jgi:16S rRNA (adenine1518-N6/adenine1519-N6)-dimethyltransferase
MFDSSNEKINALLNRYGIHPNKVMGQNFLIDEMALEKIINAAELSEKDHVLEIGPGLGTLTQELSKRSGKVVAIEKDKSLAKLLQGKFKNVEIIEGDVLKLNVNEVAEKSFQGQMYKLVANIPYYITSKIIKYFLEISKQPELMVLLVQKEVAQRICEKAGKHSVLSLSVQIYGEPEIISFVTRDSFYPAPEVDSAIIRIKNIRKDKGDEYYRKMFRMIKIGFSSKRKKLSSNLSGGLHLEKSEVEKKLSAIGIGPNARAQELSLQDWERVMEMF